MTTRVLKTARVGTALVAALILGSTGLAKAETLDLMPHGKSGIVRLNGGGDADDMMRRLELERGKSVVIQPAFSVKRVAVGDPEVVDFVLHGAREVQLVAKSVGDTNVLLWDRAGRIQAAIEVHVGAVRGSVVREIQRVLGTNEIAVDMAGESVVLRGNAPDLATAEQAEQIARAFFARKKDGDAAEGEPQVINALQVGGNHQVMLEIVIAEMSRTLKRAIGSNFRALDTHGASSPQIFSFLDSLVSFDGATGMFDLSDRVTLAGSLMKSDKQFDLFMEALQQNGLAKVLAEPTLVARSGEVANFLVGGEIPIPVVQGSTTGLSNVTVIFKKFGVNVQFTPTVLSSDRIHLQISPEVSEPDFNFGTTISGTTVPAFTTRRASTSIELGDGQSFAVAGLLREDIETVASKIPGAGDIPVLGALFRSSDFRKSQTELILIVTPRLVKPIDGKRVALPTDYYIEPTDFEFYLLGRLEGRPQKASGSASWRGPGLAPQAQDGELGGLIGDFGYRMPVPAPKGESK